MGDEYKRKVKTLSGPFSSHINPINIKNIFARITFLPEGSDCGTKLGISAILNEKNYTSFMYRYILDSDDLVLLTPDNIRKYIGKVIKVRSAIFCKAENGICSKCVGNLKSIHLKLNMQSKERF